MGELVAIARGGASNSRPRPTTETRPGTTLPPGLDTVRLRYRGDRGSQERLRSVGVTELRGRGELRRSKGGVTVGTFPDGMVYVEGRLRALAGEPENRELAEPELLDEASELWRDTLGLGEGTVEVGRADVTGELDFQDPRDGLDLLAAMRAIDFPWLKIGTEGFKRGEVETVYGRSAVGRAVIFRAYDKARESGEGEPGSRVRFERQARFRKDRARTVAEFRARPLGDWFAGREFRSELGRDADDVVVCNEVGALRELRRQADAGDLSWRACERLVGYVWCRGQGLPRSTRYRRSAELARLGIRLDRRLHETARVPVTAYLRDVVESFDELAA